ncbi:hypothetical protein AVEN_154087-1 [Araneus ventricosus]|uniref:Uncharacterized protein n=1 Tax=Araneus ventricosus TaxID=182803 RepID=A0A4Y2J4M3_ARAVE|nr:hypothetical protein AVEN_154087-1 [Araneus ventricosus]
MPRSFLVKKVKHPADHANRWAYREPSSPSEAEPAPPCPPSPPSHQCLSVRYASNLDENNMPFIEFSEAETPVAFSFGSDVTINMLNELPSEFDRRWFQFIKQGLQIIIGVSLSDNIVFKNMINIITYS